MSVFSAADARREGWGTRSARFASWLNELNDRVEKRTGLTIYDLPDWDFASAFEDGTSPVMAAADFIADMQSDGYL